MNITEVENAINEAERAQRIVDMRVGSMLRLCRNRLRVANVPVSVLADIKKELRDFNAHTGQWK